jgi:hypothetical protein
VVPSKRQGTEKSQETDGPVPGAERGWVARLRSKRILEIGRNAELATLNGKRFSGPFQTDFMAHIEKECQVLGVDLEIKPA